MNSIDEDKKLILSYGGATKVAKLLGFDVKHGGVQRVQNWMSRGIPPKQKLARPDLFLCQISNQIRSVRGGANKSVPT